MPKAKQKRKQTRITQRIMAQNLGCTEQTLSQWKLGKRGIKFERAVKWSELLGIDIKRLMTCPVRDRPKLLGLKK